MLYCREQQLQERRRSEGDLSTLVSGQCRGPAPTEAVLSSSLHADTGQHTGSSRYYSFLPSCLPDSKTLIITLLCCLFTVLGQGGIQAFSHLSSYISVPTSQCSGDSGESTAGGHWARPGCWRWWQLCIPAPACTLYTTHVPYTGVAHGHNWRNIALSELVPILN